MSEGTVHPLAQPVGRTHAAGAFDWRAVPSADPRASAFALDTAPALPAAAEEFSGEACREIVEDLLDRTRTGAAVAEVHAPFCESKCDGCGCWQHAYKELESRRWADALVREMAAWADTHAQAGAPIQALRFGRGICKGNRPWNLPPCRISGRFRQCGPCAGQSPSISAAFQRLQHRASGTCARILRRKD